MPKQYYRIRVALDPELEKEAECIDYLERFDENRRETVNELIVLGLEVKKGSIASTDSDIENRKLMAKKVKDAEELVESKEKELRNLETVIEEKDNQILELKLAINDLQSREESMPGYDEISSQTVSIDDCKNTGQNSLLKRLFRKKDKTVAPEVIRYEVAEKRIEDYKSLEEYVIDKNLEPGIMTMIACALDCNISYHTIFSMIENGLNAQQMRSVIDLVKAKRQREVDMIKHDKQHDE